MERLRRRDILAATLATGTVGLNPRNVQAEVEYMPPIQPKPLADGSVLIPDFYHPGEFLQCFPNDQTLTGLVTLYSYNGCLGCNRDRVMANGEILRDDLLTIACNKVAIPSPVKITNLETGLWTYALATDTGGFGGQIIADLTPATAYALGAITFSKIKIEKQFFDRVTLDSLATS